MELDFTSSPVDPTDGPAARCDRCGHPLIPIHCKRVCRNCGDSRDCSDP